ncbi:MAG: helix-turn-helix domain-containing protein [Gammaproteobacteria bacterium]
MQQNSSSDGWVQEDAAVYGAQTTIGVQSAIVYTYSRIPHKVTGNMALIGKNAILAYLALMHFADNRTGVCWPRLRTLERMTGLSQKTVKAALSRLVKLGLIEREQMRAGKNFGSNKYTVLDPGTWSLDADKYTAPQATDFIEARELPPAQTKL